MRKNISFLAHIAFAFVLLCSYKVPELLIQQQDTALTNIVNSAEDRYKVVSAFEHDKVGKFTGKVVSNVVYVNCRLHFDSHIKNEFSDYYNAEFQKYRNSSTVGNMTVFSYDTRDKAEKKRRELIKENNDWGYSTLTMEKFRVLCDD